MFVRKTFCEYNHIYESEKVYGEINENMIFFCAYTSEKAPGDSYGVVYRFDEANSEKLVAFFSCDSAELLFEHLEKIINCEADLNALLKNSKENNIEYDIFYI